MRALLRSPLVRLVGRLFASLALGLGWIAFAALIGLWLAEETGLLRRAVRDALRTRAGTFADDVELEDARLAWLEPVLELRNLQVGPRGESALVRRVRVRFAFDRASGFTIERIEATGGHVRISPALVNGLEGFSQGLARRPASVAPPAEREPPGPSIAVRDVGIDWETRRWGRLPLGRVDLDLALDPERGAELDGRLVPYLVPIAGRERQTGERAAQGEITLRGRPSGPSAFDVEAWASGVPLSTASIPKGTVLDALVPWNPRGVLAMELAASFSLDGSTLPRADARLVVRDGAVDLPGDAASGPRTGLEMLAIDLEAHYAPSKQDETWSARSWTGRSHASARWHANVVEAWGVLGPEAGEGLFAKAWCRLPDLGIDAEVDELVPRTGPARDRWNAFEPRGSARVLLAMDVPADWSAAGFAASARFGLWAGLDGRAGMTYHGWPNLPGGKSNQGFPLPFSKVTGEVGVVLDPRALHRFRVGLFDLAGQHPSGPIRARGFVQAHAVDAPPTLPGYGDSELDLALSSPSLANDALLVRALEGLADPVPPEKTWRPFDPRGGKLAVDLRLVRAVDMRHLATDLALDLEGLALRWKELPLALSDAKGRLRFVSDGRSQRGISVAARAKLATARALELALRFQLDPDAPSGAVATGGRDLDELSFARATLRGLSLAGQDVKELVARFPELGSALEFAGPRGWIDASFGRVRARAGGPMRSRAEIVPWAEAGRDEQVALQLRAFPMRTTDVRGRVIVGIEEDPATRATRSRVDVAPLVGRWSGDVSVAFMASFPGEPITVLGAGVDPASKSLRGSVAELLGDAGGGTEPDISGIGLSGRVDFKGTIRLPDEKDEGGKDDSARSRFDIHLREDTFQSGANFRLDALRGVLVLEDEVLRGEKLVARLADTPVELSNVSFRSMPEGFAFESDLEARDVPIDARHLQAFADRATIEALLGGLKWSGSLDVERGHVTLRGKRAEDAVLVFSGTVRPTAMSIVLGLPLSVREAVAEVKELVIEGGRMRTFAKVNGLSGRIAGRALEDADLLVTYVEPRLSIEEIRGRLAGGEIRALGEGSDRGGTLFSIDLTAPYPFQLALDLRALKVEEFLQGLFVSNVASKGRLDCRLRLTGDMENLLRVEGSGSLILRDSYLWSVPVIRTLLETVKLGSTVTFDSMATNVSIENGKVRMRDIRVASAALQLAGSGVLDFDGSLDYDLEVRLSQIKNLAWLLRFVSWITDNIVSVTISGDLDRPDIQAHWFGIFGKRGSFRALPLPGYAPLPPRF